MSIQAPQGILNIPNAILRVGKLSVDEVVGADTILNTVARNTILLVDDVAYHENKNWALKLPNAWAGEFECNTASAGNYSEFNFYNEGASSNAQGYNLTFNDTTVELRYDGSLLKTGTLASTVTGTGVKKVRLMFERTILSVTVDGTLVFTYTDTSGPRPRVYSTTAGGFLNFFTNGGAIKNLKIVNEKWISDGTSNIAYVGGGEVAVGKALAFNRVSNVSQIKVDSNVVAEYTGPHDRPLRKYPEVAILSGQSGLSGGYTQDGYVVEASSEFSAIHAASNAFNHIQAYQTTDHAWISGANTYGLTDGLASSGTSKDTFQGVDGSWLGITLPVAIRLDHVHIYNRFDNANSVRPPKTGIIWASNDGTSWYNIFSFDNLLNTDGVLNVLHVNNTNFYTRYRVQITAMHNDPQKTSVAVGELEYYGYEEGSGSLDTTLKSVYNVPATTGTQLEVYYDANKTSNYTLSGSDVTNVSDLSPQSRDSTATNVTIDSTWNAFRFSGSGSETKIENFTISGGDYVHSISLWFNSDEDYTDITSPDTRKIFFLGADVTSGSAATDGISALQFTAHDNSNEGYLRWYHWGNDTNYSIKLRKNEWYHVTLVYKGGTSDTQEVYINNKIIEPLDSGSSSNQISLPTTIDLFLGRGRTASRNAFKGMIANFRLYSKALNADQVKELYDYQKDYFLGSKSQVTLYKGHLGVGVTEPSGQLELAGDERIQEYPPRGMTGYETLVEGHGVFCASASSEFSDSFPSSEAFNDSEGWISKSRYNVTVGQNGVYTGSVSTNGVLGEWLEMKSPYGIKLSGFNLASYPDANSNRQPRNFVLFGSTDGNIWNQMKSVNNLTSGYTLDGIYHTVNSTKYYTYFRVVVSAVQDNTDGLATITRLRYFGTPGPTTLDKGSLTLGRSLDVPRISRYDVDTETPRPEKLVLDFDTTVNSSPTDISGKGNHGAFYGTNMNYLSADKAFVFNGTDDYIKSTISPSITGEFVHSYSIWLNFTALEGNYDYPIIIGSIGALDQTSILRQNSTGQIGPSFGSGYNLFTNLVPDTNRWYHMVVVYRGGAVNTTNVDYYIDGVKQTLTGGSTGTLAINENTLALGATSTGGEPFKGKISNFKLYDVALEPSEVKKLYNLGRTGRSMVISDTAVGIGKVPEAQLDVRGNISATGTIRSKRPMWSAGYQPGSNTTLPTMPTSTVIVFGNLNYDYTGNYSTSTGHFTVPVSGYYLIGTRALLYVPTSETRIDVEVLKVTTNGTTIRVIQGERVAGSEGGRATDKNMSVQISGTVYLVEGEKVFPSYKKQESTSGAHIVSIANDFNEFWGFLIEQV